MENLPLVSFIIPTSNSYRTIEKCLKSIREQEYPKIEIIIIDGGSTDGTLEIAKDYADKVVVLKGPLGFARAYGAKLAKGEILGIFDSDVYLPHKKWLKKAVETLLKYPRAAILWPVNIPPENASAVAKAYFALWEYRLRKSKSPIPGGNILVKRKAYTEVGGINPHLHFGEDYDLTLKILKQGYTYIIYPDPIIHDTMHSLKQYTRKQFWGAYSLTKASPDIVKTAMMWEPSPNKNIMLNGLNHALSFIRSIPLGIKRGYGISIMFYLPLLMIIRLAIYGSAFLLKSKTMVVKYWCPIGLIR